jgi:HEPN domain-containing protein
MAWINRARSNLARAKYRIPEAYLEDLCFDAQQAAEKAVKAVLIRRTLAFPFVHDLAKLLTILERSGLKVPKYVRRAERLTAFAVEPRYPSFAAAVTEKQYRGAVRAAEAVFGWALRHVQRP